MAIVSAPLWGVVIWLLAGFVGLVSSKHFEQEFIFANMLPGNFVTIVVCAYFIFQVMLPLEDCNTCAFS